MDKFLLVSYFQKFVNNPFILLLFSKNKFNFIFLDFLNDKNVVELTPSFYILYAHLMLVVREL